MGGANFHLLKVYSPQRGVPWAWAGLGLGQGTEYSSREIPLGLGLLARLLSTHPCSVQCCAETSAPSMQRLVNIRLMMRLLRDYCWNIARLLREYCLLPTFRTFLGDYSQSIVEFYSQLTTCITCMFFFRKSSSELDNKRSGARRGEFDSSTPEAIGGLIGQIFLA